MIDGVGGGYPKREIDYRDRRGELITERAVAGAVDRRVPRSVRRASRSHDGP
jgi:hypothetical protein